MNKQGEIAIPTSPLAESAQPAYFWHFTASVRLALLLLLGSASARVRNYHIYIYIAMNDRHLAVVLISEYGSELQQHRPNSLGGGHGYQRFDSHPHGELTARKLT